MVNAKLAKRLPYIIALAVVIGILVFILRGPHISNYLKKMILPEIEMATGKSVVASKIYINIFPLFIEAKKIKIFDENGTKIIHAQRVKAYIDLSGLLSGDIAIRRLVIKEPEITADKQQIEDITDNINAYSLKEKKTLLNVVVKVIEVQDGAASLRDDISKITSDIAGFKGEMIIGKEKRISVYAKKIVFLKEGWPEFTGDALVDLTLKDKLIQINRLAVSSMGSTIKGAGSYKNEKASLKFNSNLFAMTMKKIFGLNKNDEGSLQTEGNLTYGQKGLLVDLKVSGSFYLETLMELLDVEDRVEGLVDVNGEIKGPLNDIKGTGIAVMHNGNLYGVDIDHLKSDVKYEKGRMRFTDASSRLYNGSAKASASIQLPVVNTFTLNIDFSDVDSLPLFELIGWDPGISPGKVDGSLTSSGAEFDPKGLFEYKNTKQGKDALGRVSSITGSFDMNGPVLSLTDVKVNTGRTELNASGDIDVNKETLDLKSSMKTEDAYDLSSPYYENIKGRADFNGTITGSFDDPVIKGIVRMYDPVIEGYSSAGLDADITYRKNFLEVRRLSIKAKDELCRLEGGIDFKKANTLFEFVEPEYKLKASLNNADLKSFSRIFYADFSGEGFLSADIRISGRGEDPVVKGLGHISNADVYGVAFDSADFDLAYDNNKINFTNMKVSRGKSSIKADAYISTDGRFSYKAEAENILLSDILRKQIEGDAVFSAKTEGHGTFDDPSININAKMIGGKLKGKKIGGGDITASIKEKNIDLEADLINKRVKIKGSGRLDGERPWDLKVDVQSGRYDFLINPFLRDVPEDLILSLSGKMFMHGDRNNIFADASIKHIVLSMYGYSFTNEQEIELKLENRKLDMNSFSMRSGNTSLNISGDMTIGRQYNVVLEGSSSLLPFKSISPKIAVLKGDAECVFKITGDWDTPQIYGGLTLTNGAFGLKDYYHRISSLNGYIYIDNDRIVLRQLTGKTGGGDIELSGVLYLQKFAFKRFYVETKLNDISASVSKNFNVNFGGNILYKGTPDSQIFSGDIKIIRARYKERVEWKSWLLSTKRTEKYKAEISSLEKAALNIKVTGKNNIFIDNNVARATMSSDLVLRGTIYRPVLFGRLESKEGTVYFRNNEFKILNASADFADPNRINPVIVISAETYVSSYKIKMNLEGQIDRFNMTLSSDPSLKEVDILALLTVGQTAGDVKGLEGGIGAGEATSFVTGKVQDVVEERMKTITGLDRFQIDPYVSKTTGAVEPRVTVSKRLLADKMFVTYTTAVGAKEEQIIKVEYFLNRKMSLIGVRDERGILGGDVKFRFEFK